jgi:translocation protein SEC72
MGIEQELLTFLADVERLQKKVEDKKQEARATKSEPPSTPVAAAA